MRFSVRIAPTSAARTVSIGDLEHFLQLWQVEIHDDGAVDVKSRRGAVAVTPLLHLPAGAGRGSDIHLGIVQLMGSQPGARLLAIRAPFGAVHHNAPVREGNGCRFGWFRAVAHFGIDLADHASQLQIGRLLIDVMHVHVADDALLVDHEQGAFGGAFRPQYAIHLSDRAMWPKITQERVGDPAKVFCPRRQSGDGVNADTQNLGVQSRETSLLGFVKRDLLRSYRGPGEGVKGEHDVSSTVLAEGDVGAQV